MSAPGNQPVAIGCDVCERTVKKLHARFYDRARPFDLNDNPHVCECARHRGAWAGTVDELHAKRTARRERMQREMECVA